MGFYGTHILPKIVDLTCGQRPTMRQREKIVPLATGRVLDIGIGSGHNLPYYDAARVTKLWGLDPAAEMTRMARARARTVEFEVEFIDLPGEEVPLGNASIDTVVITYALCTIPDAVAALAQVRRVLTPNGRLLFCEHGAAPDPKVRRWQDRINPVWKRFAGGCHLNRIIPEIIEHGGFRIEEMQMMYLPGWRPASFNFWGSAVPDERSRLPRTLQ